MNVIDLTDYLDSHMIGWSLHVDEETNETSLAFSDFQWFHEDRIGRPLTLEDLSKAREVICDVLGQHFDPWHRLSVDFGDSFTDVNGDEIKFIEVSYYIGELEPMTLTELVDRYWSLISSVHDMTDPGTYGYPYIFMYA